MPTYNDTCMSVDELVPILNVSRGVVYEQIRTGVIPSLRLGKRIVIPRARFYAWLEGTAAKEIG